MDGLVDELRMHSVKHFFFANYSFDMHGNVDSHY